jgi:hypothetical protein
MTTPWRTDEGHAAMDTRMRLLAREPGDIGEFARDVVAGRASPRDLLYSSVLDEDTIRALHADIDAWHALPEAERDAAIAAAPATTAAEIAALAAYSEPKAPEPPDEDDGRGYLSDAW